VQCPKMICKFVKEVQLLLDILLDICDRKNLWDNYASCKGDVKGR